MWTEIIRASELHKTRRDINLKWRDMAVKKEQEKKNPYQVKHFMNTRYLELGEKISEFLRNHECKVIDIKYICLHNARLDEGTYAASVIYVLE